VDKPGDGEAERGLGGLRGERGGEDQAEGKPKRCHSSP